MASPPSTSLAGDYGAAPGPASAAPNMIGDFFGGGMAFVGFQPVGQPVGGTTTVPIAGGDRRFKIVESNNPLPADRVFFNYNHFQNPLRDAQNQSRDFDRYTFGAEKTFFNEVGSLELRIPFGGGLDATQSFAPGADLGAEEFGNLGLALKLLLVRGRRHSISAGLGMVFPTGEDARLLGLLPVPGQNRGMQSNVVEVASVYNQAIHLQPFAGWLWRPTDRWYTQAFAQCDFDASGNLVNILGTPSQRLWDQNLLFLDLATGYWVYQDPSARCLRGIAPFIELHYSTTMQNSAAVVGQIGTVTNPANRMDVLNLTGGFHFALGGASDLAVAAVVPL